MVSSCAQRVSSTWRQKSSGSTRSPDQLLRCSTTDSKGEACISYDEPEAALSPTRQLAALSRIHELVQKKSQFIIATHSPIIMAYPDATIFFIDAGEIKSVDYASTEHFQITRQFLNHPKTMLSELLDKTELS